MNSKISTKNSNTLKYLLSLVFFFSVFCLINPGRVTTSMDSTAYATAWHIFEHGRVGLDEEITHELVQGRDGRFYSYVRNPLWFDQQIRSSMTTQSAEV